MMSAEDGGAAERHSGSWAVGSILKEKGQRVSAAVLFGIGRSAWYRFTTGQATPRLLTQHPQGVFRMLTALNVSLGERRRRRASRFDADGLWGVLDYWRGRPLLLEVSQDVLLCLREGLETAGGYYVWTTGEVARPDKGAWPVVRLRTADHAEGLAVPGDRFVRAWQRPVDTGRPEVFEHAVYHLPAPGRIRWNRRVVLRAALVQFRHQMTARWPGMGHTGLAALEAFTSWIDRSGAAAMEPTRRVARWDAGRAAHRDIMVDFLREARRILDDRRLDPIITLYDEVAQRWRELLAGEGPRTGPAVVRSLRQILGAESAAVAGMAGSVA